MSEWPERFKDLALEWIGSQWNEPSREDYYLMRIAQRVQQANSSKPVSLKDQIIKFDREQKRTSMEERVARSKAVWMGGVKMAEKSYQEKRRGN